MSTAFTSWHPTISPFHFLQYPIFFLFLKFMALFSLLYTSIICPSIYSPVSPFNVASVDMCLQLTPWDWITYWRILTRENYLSLTQQPFIVCSTSLKVRTMKYPLTTLTDQQTFSLYQPCFRKHFTVEVSCMQLPCHVQNTLFPEDILVLWFLQSSFFPLHPPKSSLSLRCKCFQCSCYQLELSTSL